MSTTEVTTTDTDTATATPAARGMGAPIKGPTALGSDPVRFWHLTRALAVTDFKLKFFGSVLGYAWQLMRPLLLFGVLYVVFTEIVSLGKGVPYYGVMLLMGIVLFSFFSESTAGAVTSLSDRENLVRRIEFPRLAVPMSVVLTALMNLGLNLIVVIIFLMISGGSVLLTWIEMPLLVLMLTFLCAGLGMLLSVGYVRYRDVRPIWDVVLQIMFYATPIFYTITTVEEQNEELAQILMYNPFAAILQQMRHAVIDHSQPSAAEAIGGAVYLLVPAAITVALFVVGYRAFRRDAPNIA